MDACPLHFFTWAVRKSESGQAIVTPVCPTHPHAPVAVEESGDDYVVTCSVEGLHLLNMCPKADFDREQNEATRLLVPGWAA